MDALFKLKDSFVNYLSPSSKRRRTIGPGTPSRNAAEHEYLPNSEPRGLKEQKAAFGHPSKKYPSTPETKNPRKRAREDDEDQYEISPSDSVSQVAPYHQSVEGSASTSASASASASASGSAEQEDDVSVDASLSGSAEQDEDSSVEVSADGSVEEEDDVSVDASANGSASQEDVDEDMLADDEEELESEEEEEIDPEAAAQAKVQEYLARQAELELRRGDVAKVKAAGNWHKDAVFLYERLAMRSFEELMPQEWQIDFRTLPEDLFTKDEENAFVNANCMPRNHAVRALQGLLSLGIRVRDMLTCGKPPERVVAREIKHYIKWSERDGGYEKMLFIPVLHVVYGRPGQSAASLTKAINTQMKFLADKHRQHLRATEERINEFGEVEQYTKPLPLLYGMIVAQTKIIFVNVDPADPDSHVRPLSTLDFLNKDMDVWNGFAIAFMIIVARNYIMSTKDELEIDPEPWSDPDA